MSGDNAPRKPKKYVHRTFDDLVEESKMVPIIGDTHDIVPKNALEAYFIKTAFKHGVIDQMFDPETIDRFDEEPF